MKKSVKVDHSHKIKLLAKRDQPKYFKSILNNHDISSIHIEQPPASEKDISKIEVELVSDCFTEDEEIVEWQTSIGNFLGDEQNCQEQKALNQSKSRTNTQDEISDVSSCRQPNQSEITTKYKQMCQSLQTLKHRNLLVPYGG